MIISQTSFNPDETFIMEAQKIKIELELAPEIAFLVATTTCKCAAYLISCKTEMA
jgi:hypothetical protein